MLKFKMLKNDFFCLSFLFPLNFSIFSARFYENQPIFCDFFRAGEPVR